MTEGGAASAGLRIAVVGAGLIGRRHAEAIETSRAARLAAIADPDPAAKKLSSRFGVPYYGDIDALLAGDKPDGIIVATPNRFHIAHAMACIDAGVPVLVEKPLADNIDGAAALVEAADRAGVPLLVGHHRRHNPLVASAKARIASGALGTIVSAHGMFWLMKPDDYFDVAWRRQAGAGPLLVNLIHDIDLMRHLVGDIETVQAVQSNAIRGHEVEETGVVIFRFANGALGTFNLSDTIVSPWSWELTAAENPAYPATGQSCYVIGGTHGSLELPQGRLWSNQGKRSWWEPLSATTYPVEHGDPLVRQIVQFAKVIRGEEPPLAPGREGLRTLKVIDAVKRAAASGETVAV